MQKISQRPIQIALQQKQIWRQIFFFLGLAVGLGLSSHAAESGSEDNFLLHHWGSEDGLIWGDIKALARTPDGFLWIAADLGLVRFDGVQFQTLNIKQFPLSAHDRVSCLLVDRQGCLLAGTEAGFLLRGSHGRFVEIASAGATGGKKLTALAEDIHGDLWAATATAGVRHYHDGHWQTFTTANGLPDDSVTDILSDQQGRIWVLAGGKLAVWAGESFLPAPQPIPSAEPVKAITTGKDGCLWAATTFASRGFGGNLFRLKAGVWSEPSVPYSWPQDSMRSTIRGLLEDPSGGIWVTTTGGGVFHWQGGGAWNSLTQEGPMANTTANTFICDQEGTLWFGLQGDQLFRARQRAVTMLYPEPASLQHIILTTCAGHDGGLWLGTYGGGIFHYRNGNWINYGPAQGLATPFAFTLLEDSQTNLWAGIRGGLFRLENGQFKLVPEFVSGAVLSLFEDRAGNIWAGGNYGLARLKDHTVKIFKRADGLEHYDRDVCAIGQAPDDLIWVAVRGYGLFRQVGEKFEAYVTHSPLDYADIRTIFFDQHGGIWLATFGQGLFCLKNGHIYQWRSQDGLPSDYLVALTEDAAETFWLGTANGIFGCARENLNQSMVDGGTALLGRHLTVAEGLDIAACSGWSDPAVARTRDGRLWFPNQNGVAVFNPATLNRAGTQWPVIIEDVSSDGIIQMPDNDGIVRIQSGLRRLEFHYTLPNLMVPAIQFRYRLKGLEEGWTDAGQRRTADYNNLPPGHYSFSVMAGGLNGIWQETQQPLAIIVVPRWWERNPLRVTAAAGLLGSLLFAVWTIGRARLRRRLLILEMRQAAEDERQRIARDLHDNLGAGLTEIALMSDLAKADAEQAVETRKNLSEIFATTRSLARSLDETVWAISQKNETVEQSLVFIFKAGQDFLRLAGISCRLDVPEVLPDSYFSSAFRHNLFLASREVLNNIVKHAQATEVWLRLKIEADQLMLIIEDNGKGFALPPSPAETISGPHEPARSGLSNLDTRLQAIGGTVGWQSEPGRGTTVKLTVPLKR